MALLDWLFRRKSPDITLEAVRREEFRLGIKESQFLAKLEKLEGEREEIFARGARTTSPARRGQLARLYDLRSRSIELIERELNVLSKELTTLMALRLALERKRVSQDKMSKVLSRLDEPRLEALLKDDRLSTDAYLEKLGGILGVALEKPAAPSEVGKDGLEVLQVWEKMDEGAIDTLEEGIRQADRARRKKEPEA